MNKLHIKLQVELLRSIKKTIEDWEKTEYAEMLDKDSRDSIIISSLLDAVNNVYIDASDEICPHCIISGLVHRLFFPSKEVGETEDGMSIEELDANIENMIDRVDYIIASLKDLLEEEDE